MGRQSTTIRSIADELGISVSTVSRVMNGLGKKYRISEKTIKEVEKTADKLNYVPNNIAKSLRLKKTSTIGLIIPDISNPWFAKIASKIEKQARKKGYNIFLCNSDDSTKVEKRSLKLLQNWMVDGIIVVPIGLKCKHLLKASQKGMPVVLVDRFFEEAKIPYVSTNNFEGAYQATEHLVKNGHDKIACIQGVVGTSSNNQRLGGYKKALSDYNIPLDETLIIGDNFGFGNGYNSAHQMIEKIQSGEVTAIFSVGNQITLGVLKAFREKGIQIPEDVSIISYDEQNYSDLLYTPLSTISHLANGKLGKLALKMLLDKIEEKILSPSENIILPTKLINRESVKKINT